MSEQKTFDNNADKALLEEQLKKLDLRNFDWSAWKKGTLLVLEKIFGRDSIYFKELSNTDYHYNSWSLRDTSGSEDPVKASVRELIQICITDVSNRTEQPPKKDQNLKKSQLLEVVKQFLSDATMSELIKISQSDTPEMMKEEQTSELLKEKMPKHQEVMLGKLLLTLFRA